MSIFDAIIQGIVQGLTEFLPVSSSGHLAITQHILGTSGDGNLFFNVMLHVGTLVAVIAFYYKLIWSLIKEFFSMIKDIFTGKFKWSQMNYERNLIMMLIIGLIPLFLLFIPIPGTAMKIKDLAEVLSASPILLVTAISLLVTSALLTVGIICNRRNSTKGGKHLKGAGKANSNGRESYTILDAVCVGLMQVAAAVFPGLSRSGSTLAVGEMRGINKQKALDYTFVLGVPSIVAAALLEGIDAIKSPEGINVEIGVIIAGVIASAVVGYLAIVIFKWFLKSDKMSIFVIYTAIVGIAFIVISIIEMNTGVNLFTGAPINW
ncbi:undecaprenyl-diphosphate phosphatase [Ruminococcus sp.]|uniref:undecaprenyl-diphosphate phosphatase n=1 Tax=Ruminococcus sp. TaxID=41978 RepID=UPI0025FF6E60|nr:undecaprenyl-diphosphate phosphatase [Ruminococcus sp.]MCI6616834.1 undecaprenyl-diphosphate phosphatase [Ruminococcus sp.]